MNAEVAALLLRRELVLEVHRRRARLDHLLHQLERVQRAAEAGLGVGDDRGEPVRRLPSFAVIDLVGALQRLVDPLHDRRNRVRRIERLVGVHVTGKVGVGGDLPAAEVDGLQAGADLLNGLIAGEGAEGGDVRLSLQKVPQPLRAHFRERVPDVDRTAEAVDVIRGVVAGDAVPARVVLPVALEGFGFAYRLKSSRHSISSVFAITQSRDAM